jgi:hypothetical protein
MTIIELQDRGVAPAKPDAGVDGKDEAHDLAIPAGDFQAFGGPALIGRQGDNAPLMGTDRAMANMRVKQQLTLRHEAEDPLMINRLGARCATCPVRSAVVRR